MPDQDFLTRIQAAEQEAEQIIAQAVEQGRIRQEQARQAAQEAIVACRSEAEQMVQEHLAKARVEANEMLAQGHGQAQVASAAIQQSAQDRRAAAVAAVRERIVTDSVRH